MAVVTVELSSEEIGKLKRPDLSLPKRAKNGLRLALKQQLVPIGAISDETEASATVAVSSSEEQKIRALPLDKRWRSNGLDAVVSGLIRASIQQSVAANTERSGAQWITGIRTEQKTLCQTMAAQDKRNNVLFAEAATGVGKGRALVAHACYLIAAERSARVVVAAPTIAVLGQLYAEYKNLNSDGRPVAASIIGIGEYVSESALEEILASESAADVPNVDKARAWLLNEAEKPSGSLRKGWLCESLETAAPEFPISEVRLTHSLLQFVEKDRGAEAFAQSADDAANAKIIFCTHAMLALDIFHRRSNSKDRQIPWARKGEFASGDSWQDADIAQRLSEPTTGILPSYDSLLVDEAHLLETSFDLASSQRISLFSLKVLIDKFGNPALKKTMRRTFKTLVGIGDQGGPLRLGSEVSGHLDRRASDLLGRLVRSIKNNERHIKHQGAKSALREVRKQLYWLARKSEHDGGFWTRMLFSPSRNYPSIERAKHSVRLDLRFLWRYVRSSVLTSATLYMQYNGGNSIKELADELSVPDDLVGTMRPIQPTWVTAPVEAFLPVEDSSLEGGGLLMPPKYNSDQAVFAKYYDTLAAWIEDAFAKPTAGGILVLATSYASIDELEKRLANTELADRVVASKRERSFRLSKDEYVRGVERRQSPIWLATGRAWTGLNLSMGERARDDHAIDAIVIPRLPFLMNASTRHREKLLDENGNRAYAMCRETYHCSRYLRQGIGRLVRRRNVPEKRVYVLDGRLAKRGSLVTLRNVFVRYKQQPLVINKRELSVEAI